MIDNKLRITAGNTFATAHTITAQDVQGQPIPDFDLQECTDIQVYARNSGSYKPVTSWQLDDQSVVVLWCGKQMKLGGYDFYIAGKFNGADWRTSEATIFEIVQYNEEANIPSDTIVVDGTYFLDASFSLITEIQGGGGGATPSDELPLMDGTADAGTSAKYSRGDHVHPSDTNKQDVISDLATIRSGAAAGATAVQPAALSGYQPLIDNDNKLDYSLLDNTPTIPAAQVNSDWNASSGVAQILNKPAIPTVPTISTDISSDATSDTKTASPKAVKTYADSVAGDTNVIEGIKMNNTSLSPDANKVVDLGTVITAHQDISGKADKSEMSVSTSSDQTTITLKSGTSATVINSHQSLSSKQDTLVSGTNIKTINGNSVLGNGNLSTLTPIVNHGTSGTTYSIIPNILHIWGTVSSLTLTLATPTDNTIVNEYMIEFVSGSTATTLSLPSSVEWAESCGSLSVEASKTYQISIVNNIGLWASISNS